MILLTIILAIVGLVMVIRPDIIWFITERWKSYDATEPSDLYRVSTRFGGILCFLAGIGGVIALSV